MNFWRDTKRLWSDAWARSPLRVVIGVTCMLAILAAALVFLSDDSDAVTAAPQRTNSGSAMRSGRSSTPW